MAETTPQKSDLRLITLGVMVIASVAIAGALYWLRALMIPFVLAVFLSYGLTPLVDLLVARLRVPRLVAVFGALLIGIGVFVGVGSLIGASLQALSQNTSVYEARFNSMLADLSAQLAAWGLPADLGANLVSGIPVGQLLGQTTQAVMGLFSNTFMMLIFMIYLLEGHSQRTDGMRGEIEQRIKRYLLIKTGLSAITGVLVAVLLTMLGVDLAMVFGVLAFVLNFIPSVGSIIATFLPLPILLFDPDLSTTILVLALVLPGAVQMVIGNVLEPKLLGESLELHPVTILLCLIFWGMLWGIPGMVLAAPVTAVLKILLEAHPLTKPVAQLMAGQR